MTTSAAQIESFIARYTPKIAAQLRRARRELRRQVPRGYELVYDSHNALVFAYAATPKASGIVMSIAAYPLWVTLFFARGRALADPDGLLQGSGSTVRSIRLAPFEVLKSRPVQALMKRALAVQAEPFRHAPRLSTEVRAVAPQRRPRRPPPGKR
jgi:hypothetical protein